MRGEQPLVNFHHTLFERAHYRRQPVLRALRNHRGLIIPMMVVEHRALHKAVNRTPLSMREPSVPAPSIDAARYFLSDIVLPYTPEQPRLQTLEQAIGWFAMTDNQDTAEHLALQRDFIVHTTPFHGDFVHGNTAA